MSNTNPEGKILSLPGILHPRVTLARLTEAANAGYRPIIRPFATRGEDGDPAEEVFYLWLTLAPEYAYSILVLLQTEQHEVHRAKLDNAVEENWRPFTEPFIIPSVSANRQKYDMNQYIWLTREHK